jgi:hypothetical protein
MSNSAKTFPIPSTVYSVTMAPEFGGTYSVYVTRTNANGAGTAQLWERTSMHEAAAKATANSFWSAIKDGARP